MKLKSKLYYHQFNGKQEEEEDEKDKAAFDFHFGFV